MVIDQNVATAVKNFLENYAEIHGLPSPGRGVNRITQSITYRGWTIFFRHPVPGHGGV